MPDLAELRAEGLIREAESEIRAQEILDAFSARNYTISLTEGDTGVPVTAPNRETFLRGLVEAAIKARANVLVFKQWPFRRFNGTIYAEMRFMRRGSTKERGRI